MRASLTYTESYVSLLMVRGALMSKWTFDPLDTHIHYILTLFAYWLECDGLDYPVTLSS